MSTAVVTGAGRGIGRAIALRPARDGPAAAVNDIGESTAEGVAGEIAAAGGSAVAVPADVTDRDAVFALVTTVRELTRDDLGRIFDVNVFGVLWCLQAAAERMIAQGTGGKTINAASIAAHSGFASLGHHAATEFAVRGLAQAAAKEPAPHKDTVTADCPGLVGTDMWDLIDEQMGPYLGSERGETLARYAQLIAPGRVQTPEDVAGLVSYLAGPDSDHMTGQSVIIDGGIVMS